MPETETRPPVEAFFPDRCIRWNPSGSGELLDHDWRLLSLRRFVAVESPDPTHPDGTLVITGHRQTWYCTRCRLVEERCADA